MKKFFFTFGSNHTCPNYPEFVERGLSNKPLGGYYVTIESESESEARNLMFSRYEAKWSMSYGEDQFEEAIKRFDLIELEYLTVSPESETTKYFKIQNNGLLDVRLIALMGGTTKIEDHTKIGQFGTGLKYAISYLVRNENKFKLFIGENEIIFECRDQIISDHSFKEIFMNDVSMNITTRYGYQWKAWEAIRELWCNAKDEGGELKDIIDSDISGDTDKTTFYIEYTPEIENLINTWNQYFIDDVPLYEDDKVSIYTNPGKNLKIYKNRVLIHVDSYYKSQFIYDFKGADLNELRQYLGYAPSEISKALLSSNKAVVDVFLDQYRNNTTSDKVEYKLDFQYTPHSKDHVKEIFSGYMFLHPESDRAKGNKSIKVSKSLFNVLQEAGCPSEKYSSTRGRSYGGSGYGYEEDEVVTYSEINHKDLENKIQTILNKYKSDIEFTIVLPSNSDFELFVEESGYTLFSSDLDNSSLSDLESIVLVAIFNSMDGNIFKALKRLIKFARSNKAFEKIFFGNIK